MRFLPFLLLAACASETPNNDVVGPFTGEARRFAVDTLQLPAQNTEAREFAGDLDGDDIGDNQLGMVIATLASQDDITTHGQEMIAAGAIASSVIITADDFENDPTVSVKYIGADGDTAIEVGGTLTNGVFVPNFTRETKVAGTASLHLPVFVTADASVFPVIGLEIELKADGAGGFDAELHGAAPHEMALSAAYSGITQMLTNAPGDHIIMLSMLDEMPRDGVVTRDEFDRSDLIQALLAPDLRIGGKDALSIGFRAHLRPCADGSCVSTPAPTCFDRVTNGDETGVDCGGDSCRACAAGATCSAPSDCESNDCTTGVCGAPSCSNGVRDGVETDVDCGFSCGDCALGKRCLRNADCASGQCGPPCPPDSLFCDSGTSFETCR